MIQYFHFKLYRTHGLLRLLDRDFFLFARYELTYTPLHILEHRYIFTIEGNCLSGYESLHSIYKHIALQLKSSHYPVKW